MMQDFENKGIKLKGRTSGQFKTTCPECSHTRKKKNDTCLSVNIDEGVYTCHNCGWKGTVKKIEKVQKTYKVPESNNTKLSDKTLNWFVETRKISKATVMRFGLTESNEFMPQVEKERNCINFNYFRDEKLVNIKFRDGQKNFKMVSGAQLIFYNLDMIKDSDTVIITEGEIDAMSFYEAGYSEVISVPNGASKGNQRLEYLDNCIDFFENKIKIILATDTDEAGIILRNELARRLGKERCAFLTYPEGCKDANDVLVRYGIDELRKVVQNASEWPMEGIITIGDIEERINNLYLNGFPEGAKIGFETFDKHISFKEGQLTIITGIPSSGKSEFVDEIMVRLAQIQDWKFGVFSAENQPEEYHFMKWSEKHTSKSFFGLSQFRQTPEDVLKAKYFINDHFYFVQINEDNSVLDELLLKFKQLINRKGINAVLIDPWNYLEHDIPKGYSETQYISEALTKICRFAKINNIHIFLVAHPVKIKKDANGKYMVATPYDIAGSAHFFNKADNCLSVYRDFDTNLVTVYIQKVRFRFIGKIGKVDFQWENFTGKYNEVN